MDTRIPYPSDLTGPQWAQVSRFIPAPKRGGRPAKYERREIVNALWAAPLLGRFARLASWAGIGLLPERIRIAFGVEWRARDEKWLGRMAAASRRIRPLVPNVFATNPQAVIAEWNYHRRPAGATP